MAKKRIGAGLVAAAAGGLCACTAVLGDFQVGTTGGQDSGAGSSGAQVDGSSGTDATMGGGDGSPQDGGTMGDTSVTDAGTDASQAPVLLTCAPAAGAGNTTIATIARSSSNDQNTIHLFNVGTPNQTTYRAIVPEQTTTGPTIYHTYSFGGGGNSQISDAPIPYNNGNVVAISRFQGGIAALASENFYDAGPAGVGVAALDVYTIQDNASAWTGPVILTSGGPLQTCANRQAGALDVLNASSPPPTFIYDYVYQTCGSSPTTVHLAGQSGGPPAMWPLALEDMLAPDGGDEGVTVDAAAQGFGPAGITVATNGSTTYFYALANSGSNGPAPGIGSTLFTAPQTNLSMVGAKELPLVNPADLMQAIAIQTLTSTQIGLVFLEADLGLQNVTPLFYVGTVTPSQMGTLDPSSDLPVTALDGISDIPINSASYHWENFTQGYASDNLLGVGPVFTTYSGLNFLWWDSSGTLRARQTGATALFADAGTILGGDMTFNSAPFPALGQLEVVYSVADSDSSNQTTLYATQLQCTTN